MRESVLSEGKTANRSAEPCSLSSFRSPSSPVTTLPLNCQGGEVVIPGLLEAASRHSRLRDWMEEAWAATEVIKSQMADEKPWQDCDLGCSYVYYFDLIKQLKTTCRVPDNTVNKQFFDTTHNTSKLTLVMSTSWIPQLNLMHSYIRTYARMCICVVCFLLQCIQIYLHPILTASHIWGWVGRWVALLSRHTCISGKSLHKT